MNHNHTLPEGMEGVYEGGTSCNKTLEHKLTLSGHKIQKLPKYWGIDLVFIPAMIALTIYVILHWHDIVFRTAQILAHVLIGATILMVFVVVIGVIVCIRNKRVW